MTIYGVSWFDYESSGIASHHFTKEGAYKAMRRQMELDYSTWFDDRLVCGKKWNNRGRKFRGDKYVIIKIVIEP